MPYNKKKFTVFVSRKLRSKPGGGKAEDAKISPENDQNVQDQK